MPLVLVLYLYLLLPCFSPRRPLATVISRLEARGHTYELDVAGGVIATRADNDEINSITDLKDKIIGAGSVSQILGGQVQLYDMQKVSFLSPMTQKTCQLL